VIQLRVDNLQGQHHPIDATAVRQEQELRHVLDEFRRREPFIAESTAENGFKLTIGIGGSIGCAQYSHSNGLRPISSRYWTDQKLRRASAWLRFAFGNQPTEIRKADAFLSKRSKR
jgi:hypothetical protein